MIGRLVTGLIAYTAYIEGAVGAVTCYYRYAGSIWFFVCFLFSYCINRQTEPTPYHQLGYDFK
jgi:hypothetical protein